MLGSTERVYGSGRGDVVESRSGSCGELPAVTGPCFDLQLPFSTSNFFLLLLKKRCVLLLDVPMLDTTVYRRCLVL